MADGNHKHLIDQVIEAYTDNSVSPEVFERLMDRAEKELTPEEERVLHERLYPFLTSDLNDFMISLLTGGREA